MQMKYFLHVLVMGILFSLHSFSQSANISYINAGLPEIRNTFNAGGGPFKVGGVEHYPYSGGVLYNHNDSAISLQTQIASTNAPNLGTAYAIKYPFKEGYHYTIQAVAWQTDPSQGAIQLVFSLINQRPDPRDSDPVTNGPVSQDHWVSLLNSPLAATYLNKDKSTRYLVNSTFDQAYNYLTVLAWQGAVDAAGSWAFIRQIAINETPPTYTLAPANINKVCGTPISQTFTVTDVYNSGKVSSYEWDLGSGNNGWLYNGAPAPQIIHTATPSLSLTADACSVTNSNIVVRVTRPGGTYTSNTAVITTTNPVTMSGPSQSCGGSSTYTVSNLTCGDVTWSLSPGAIGTLSNTTGTTTTLTTPAQNQGLTVYANVATTCLPKTLSQPVTVLTKPKNIDVWGEPVCQEGGLVQVSTFDATPGADSYNWSLQNGSGPIRDLPQHTAEILQKVGAGTHTIYVYAVNACGQSNTASFDFTVNRCSSVAASQSGNVSVAVSPNPASNVVVITAHTTNSALKASEKQDIREVRIIDKTGKLLRKQSFPAGTTSANIHVESFKPDIYILQIGDGKTFTTRKIRIAR